jgi:hypothetical protein
MMRIALVLAAAAAVALSAPAVHAQEVKTIRPGMTEADVRAAWGAPVTSRKVGEYAYLFYENGCLRTCGTYDLVVLQGGQVVDAIARGKEHNYDGVSSSPADRAPAYTPPSDSVRRTS